MSSERNIDPISLLILFISILAVILEIIGDFAGFYLGGINYRYSCLTCEYSTIGDYIMQILTIILLIIQFIIVLNEILPDQFISKDLTNYGMYLAITTWIFAIIGIASFGIAYGAYEWWPELGFYSLLIGGVLNTLFFYLKQKNK
ncbi:MAG: hypothetical protein ACTSV5_06040 [Promethearchaeota archaeon]